MVERAELYAHIPPTGRPIPIKAAPFLVDNNILGEEEITEAAIRLRMHRTGDPSGMRDEHLRLWLCAVKREEHPDPWNWEKVIAIIHAAFRGLELVASCTWKTVVMIPKGVGTNSRSIGLVEVLCKAISGIINFRLSSSVQFHDNLHGFLVGRGTGTTIFEVKLLQHIILIWETFLHSIFLNLRKAYGSLDRERCLDILAGYGMVPRTLYIMCTYWVRLRMAAREGGHYGPVL